MSDTRKHRRYRWSDAWIETAARERDDGPGGEVTLERPGRGLELTFEVNDVGAWRRLRRELQRQTAFGAAFTRAATMLPDPDRGFRALRRHGVLRPVHARQTPPAVFGDGPLRPVIDAVAAAGWPLGSIECCPARVQSSATTTVGDVRLLAVADRIVAVGPRGACSLCAALRLLGRLGEAEQRQTRALTSARLGLRVRLARAFTEEILLELAARALAADEAMCVSADDGLQRGVLIAHPDCPTCGQWLSRARGRATAEAIARYRRDTMAALADADSPSAEPDPDAQRAWEAMLSSPFAPMELQVLRRKRYPHGAPFVWGDVQLTRLIDGEAYCASTPGGIYGPGTSEPMCMLRAVSEGVERLAARGARAHRVLSRAPAGEPLVRPGQLDSRVARSIDRARRGYCTAYDLTNERWGWIPHEAVVVGLPRGLAGAHTRREPFYTGAASHQTLTAAIVHATREIVQRDAFMVTWYRRRAAPRIAMPADDALTDEARGLLAYVRRVRLKIELFDISTDTPLPILMLRATATRAIGVWPRGGALILATSGFTPMAALERALGLACAQLIPLGIHPHPLKDPLNPAAVRIMQRRTQFWRLMARYLDPARADAHAFLGAGGERPLASMPRFAADTPRGQLALLRRWFRRLDRAWYAVRLTGALASWCGFEVVKVVIPGLVNIAPSRADVDLRGPRLSMEWSDAMSATPHLHSHPLF